MILQLTLFIFCLLYVSLLTAAVVSATLDGERVKLSWWNILSYLAAVAYLIARVGLFIFSNIFVVAWIVGVIFIIGGIVFLLIKWR